MKHLAFWRGWSMRARLLAIIIVPAAYLCATFVWYAWHARQAEVREELAERGPLLAKVIADGSEFSLSTGRATELREGVDRIVQSDSAVSRVEVYDAARRLVLRRDAQGRGAPQPHVHEAPVLRRVIWMTVPSTGAGPAQRASAETVGYVRVTLSPAAMLRKQDTRFYMALLACGLGLLVCAVLAWHLAAHFDRSLQASIQALRAADEEKRRLIRKVNTAVEEERKSIALEIHDELNATLVAVRLEAQRIAALARDASQPEIQRRAESITGLALGLYNSGRSLVRRLRPEVLEMLGLAGAVEEMLRHYDAADHGCRFVLHADADFPRLDGSVAISAYRAVQEALSNVVKHARASRVEVTLAQRGGALHIAVADNGKGFDPALVSQGIGIVGMRERVEAFNGSFSVDSAFGAGATVRIVLPLAYADV